MSLLGMPLMVINLGGEMMYILEQRLVAQKIPPEKARKVIADIVRTMYNPKFIQELFKPQELYSSASTRQIFERIAHSSIMRLSESSMDKLYDLMTTGFKYQVVSCKSGEELYEVTVNHLGSLREMVSPDVIPLVETATAMLTRTYTELPAGSLALLRQTLLRNLQDRKVKVSPFLLDGIQNTDGSMVLQPHGMLPPHFQMPGQITFKQESGEDQIVHYPIPLSQKCELCDPDHRSMLGHNLYLKSQQREKERVAREIVQDAAARAKAAGGLPSSLGSASFTAPISTTAGAELNLLSTLLGMDSRKEEAEEGFKLSIFDETRTETVGAGKGAGDEGNVEMIVINNTGGSLKMLSSVKSELEDGGAAGGDEDDLLSLMDKAGE
eukprot:CAMPEP_0177711876 /NCGR_PEP_ID=MMETSP0484_2-20121128/12096_1 /TAXON_ID=354590 /ORGANISM="Rhodomonas lens, Strain RHODO" /LENGTH=381 /DNA_ID=CAMNT_0019223641 /DNA_START=20 /DNA_END=1165 /DNA_ORIENTATION=-